MLKRLLNILMAVSLFVGICPIPTVCAADAMSGTYADVMSSDYAGYFIKCQPNDALPLTETVVLDAANETSVYGLTGLYHLPRLSSSYYYATEEDNTTYGLANYLYPVLCITSSYTGKHKLYIKSQDTGATLATIELSDNDGAYVATSNTANVSAACFSWDITADDVIYRTADYFHSIDCETTYYNAVLNKDSIVTPKHMFVRKTLASGNSLDLNVTLKLVNTAGTYSVDVRDSGDVVDLTQYNGTLAPTKIEFEHYCNGVFGNTINVKQVHSNVLQDGKSDVLIITSTNLTVPNYTYGDVKYSSVLSSRYLYELAVVTDSMFSAYVAVNYNMTTDQYTALAQALSTTGAYAILPAVTSHDLREVTKKCVPYEIYTNGSSYSFDSDGYTFTTPSADTSRSTATAKFLGGAFIEDFYKWKVGGVYTIHFITNGGSPISDTEYSVGQEPSLPSTTKENYTLEGWYRDSSLTDRADLSDLGAEDGDTITLYAKWNYSGPTYKVTYVDLYNNTTETREYPAGQQPTLPTNPTKEGYAFKSWLIVDDQSSNDGVVYSTESFAPVAGETYLFKATFDLYGTIVSLSSTKTSYDAGATIDKSAITVTVIASSAGNRRTLAQNEFSISPTKITEEGNNSITVTYLATSATSVLTLTGKKDKVTSLKADYDGDDLTVGSKISKSDIDVTATWQSGKEEDLDPGDFTISPTYVKKEGSNKITVEYEGEETTVTVKGKESSDVKTTSGVLTNRNPTLTTTNGKDTKTLVSIEAYYKGGQLSKGDTIPNTSLSVTAHYADGSSSTVGSTSFTYTPTYVKNSGTNTIIVTYGGATASVEIVASEEPETGNSHSSRDSGDVISANNNYTNSSYNNEGKGTSIGYLDGRNILNTKATKVSSSNYDAIGIVRQLDDADENATVSLELTNGDSANVITSEMLQEVAEKQLKLIVNMLDNTNEKSIATWVFNSSGIGTGIQYDVNPNITLTDIPKASEIMTHIQLDSDKFPLGTELTINLKDIYSPGSFVQIYPCTKDMTVSKDGENTILSALGLVGITVQKGSDYIVTDGTDKYEVGDSLLQELKLVKETEDTEDEWGEEDPWESEILPITDHTPEPRKGMVTGILFLIVGSVVVTVAGISLFAITRKRHRQSIPEEEYYEEEYYEEEDTSEEEYDDTGEFAEESEDFAEDATDEDAEVEEVYTEDENM